MTHIDSGPDDGAANELRLDHLLLELGIFLRHGARVEPHIRIHLAGPEKKLDEAMCLAITKPKSHYELSIFCIDGLSILSFRTSDTDFQTICSLFCIKRFKKN